MRVDVKHNQQTNKNNTFAPSALCRCRKAFVVRDRDRRRSGSADRRVDGPRKTVGPETLRGGHGVGTSTARARTTRPSRPARDRRDAAKTDDRLVRGPTTDLRLG